MYGMQKIISMILVVVCFLCGILLLFLGIDDNTQLNKKTEDYITTKGYLVNYQLVSSGGYDSLKKENTSDTYNLIYRYKVNDKFYTVISNYSTSFLPEIDSQKDIKYDSSNPEKAVIAGTNKPSLLFFMGIFFVIIPVFFFFGLTGILEKAGNKIIEITIGIIFIFVSIVALFFTVGDFSFNAVFNFFSTSFSLPLLIPIVLIVAGIYILIKGIFITKKNK